MNEPAPPAPPARPAGRTGVLGEIAGVFLKLGFTAFGGPAAHIGLMENECVARRNWLDRQSFLDLFAALHFLPGPSSTQLAMALGHHRGRLPGLIVAGACFITPAMLIILPLGYLYVTYGQTPTAGALLGAINCAIVAIIVAATVKFARTSANRPLTAALAAAALLLSLAGTARGVHQVDLVILFAAAVLGVLLHVARRPRPAVLPALAAPLPLVLFFLKVGSILFGTGYILVSFIDTDLVQRRWMTHRQVLDAIAVGQFTPGPLLTTSTFVGYVLGYNNPHFAPGHAGAVIAAVLATLAIFFPSFVLVSVLAGVIRKLPSFPIARAALDTTNATIVGILAAAAVHLAIAAPHGPVGVLLLAACCAALLLTKVNATWLVAASAILGVLLHLTHQQQWLTRW